MHYGACHLLCHGPAVRMLRMEHMAGEPGVG